MGTQLGSQPLGSDALCTIIPQGLEKFQLDCDAAVSKSGGLGEMSDRDHVPNTRDMYSSHLSPTHPLDCLAGKFQARDQVMA